MDYTMSESLIYFPLQRLGIIVNRTPQGYRE